MPVAAIFHEGGLQRRLYPDHFRQIDVAFQHFAIGDFEVQVIETLTVNDSNPCFLGMGCIHKHTLGHILSLPPSRRRDRSLRSACRAPETANSYA